jgi:hypothetical protein
VPAFVVAQFVGGACTLAEQADVVVTKGRGDACPVSFGERCENVGVSSDRLLRPAR